MLHDFYIFPNIDSIYIIQFSSIDEKGSNRPKMLSDPANILHWTSNGTSWLSCLPVTCSPSTGYFVAHTLPTRLFPCNIHIQCVQQTRYRAGRPCQGQGRTGIFLCKYNSNSASEIWIIDQSFH